MHNRLFPAALIVLLLSAVPAASAYTSVLADVGVRDNKTCPSFTLTSRDIVITIRNAGDARETFGLSLELPSTGNWSGFIVPEIELSPGEEAKVDALFLTPSYDVPPGPYDVGVVIASRSSGKIMRQSFGVEVLRCHSVKIDAIGFDACKELPYEYVFNVTNLGSSEESLVLSASEAWANVTLREISLGRGETRQVPVRLTPPKSTGASVITFDAVSKDSYASASKDVVAGIIECYSVSATLEPVRQEVCPCRSAELQLEINNTGIVPDTYIVSYHNETYNVTLSPGKTEQSDIKAAIPCDKASGNYTLEARAGSDFVKAKAFSILSVPPLRECYWVTAEGKGAVPISLEVGKAMTYAIEVTNGGRFRQAYDIETGEPSWVHLSESRLDLEPGMTKDVYLYAAPPFDVKSGVYEVVLSVSGRIENDSITIPMKVSSPLLIGGQNGSANGGNVSLNMSIPTGGVVGGAAQDGDRPMTQIVMITILAVGVAIILVLRFVILMK